MMFVGVDGCRAGWLAVKINESDTWRAEVYTDFTELWSGCQDASLILVDIPIGLKEQGREERLCDKTARRLLGPDRGRCVFRAPCRQALSGTTFTEAGDINKGITGKRLSQQSWGILPKIKQVENLLLRNLNARGRIREIHPEVCFWALNNHQAMEHPKAKEAGFKERYEVLRSIYHHTEQVLSNVLSIYRRNQVKKDDVLDALVAALTARFGKNRLSSIPEQSETCARGLAMEMVCFLPDQIDEAIRKNDL